VGSFLNVVAYRLPIHISVVWPPSRCPTCLHLLGKTENVPVLGWLWLRGQCRWCQTPISPRYPAVEITTGLLFSLVFWRFGWQWQTVAYWLLVSFLITLTLIDWDTMMLPSSLTKSGLLIGLGFHSLQGWQQQDLSLSLYGAIAAATLGLWSFDLIRWAGTILLGQEGMGNGDPKFAALIGAWLGWQLLLLTAFLACLFGSIYGLVCLTLGRLQRRQGFPFGPFLAISSLISLIWGGEMIATYLNVVTPLVDSTNLILSGVLRLAELT
jgi:leader peptidase (prepilin peptidase)/N-methyltransferase